MSPDPMIQRACQAEPFLKGLGLHGFAADCPYQWQDHQDYTDSFRCALLMAKHEPDVTPGYNSATQSLTSLKIKNI